MLEIACLWINWYATMHILLNYAEPLLIGSSSVVLCFAGPFCCSKCKKQPSVKSKSQHLRFYRKINECLLELREPNKPQILSREPMDEAKLALHISKG